MHDLNFEGAIACRFETVTRIVVRSQDDDFVTELLEGEGGVDDEFFSSSDTEVRMNESDAQFLARRMDRVGHCG